MTTDQERARLSDLLDDLEYHRAFGVAGRLERALQAEQEALAAGATDQQMRARLVQGDMLQRSGRITAGARLATEVNWWARQHGPKPLLARSHLVLSSILDSVGNSASGLDHALRADGTPLRTRGNFLVRLGDAYAAVGSFDVAREHYREAEKLFVAIGDLERQLNVLNNLAYTEYEAGDAQRAGEAADALRSLADEAAGRKALSVSRKVLPFSGLVSTLVKPVSRSCSFPKRINGNCAHCGCRRN